jgi:hypothetical protein
MPEPELKSLKRRARTIPAGGAMVKVGPFCGRSSWCWSKSVAQDVAITCIDIWDPQEHPFSPPSKVDEDSPSSEDFGKTSRRDGANGSRENFVFYTRGCDNITAVKGRCPETFQGWPLDSLDLVFLDDVHHSPVFHADVCHWFASAKPGGMLCGDDCADRPRYPLVRRRLLQGTQHPVHRRAAKLDRPPATLGLAGLKHVYVADRPDPDHVGQADAGVRPLARAGLAAQLAGDLADLADAGGADRVAHGDQAARWVDRAASVDVECTLLQQRHGLAIGAQAHGLDIFHLRPGVAELARELAPGSPG